MSTFDPNQPNRARSKADMPEEVGDHITMEHISGDANPYGQTVFPAGTGPQVDMRPRFVIRQSPPYVTRFMLVANVVVFVAMIIYGYVNFGTINGSEDSRVLLVFGAKINQLVAGKRGAQ